MPFIDVHILQTVPPSNLNRDDTGAPKTAQFGGVRRARVSSQAWKRSTRTRFNSTLDATEIGWRTRRVVELLAEKIVQLDSAVPADETYTLAASTLTVAGLKLEKPSKKKSDPQDADPGHERSGYLVFISDGQLRRLAEVTLEARSTSTKVAAKAAKEAFSADRSFDVSLFGRMVADDAELNIDAAVQVAHAISVHAVDTEADYFTAVDDLQQRDQESGAGMIGTVEFNSSTLYRYATIDIAALRSNLGDVAATARAAATFIDSFVLSMPTGKRNTFANGTVPELVLVDWRDDLPVNLVGAFEDPILSSSGGISGRAAGALSRWRSDLGEAYGGPSRSWITSIGAAREKFTGPAEPVALDELVQAVERAVAAALVPST